MSGPEIGCPEIGCQEIGCQETGPQGIGARVPRKEDARFLHGRGAYVSDMVLPGQREVAFLRSPVAHARILGVRKPAARFVFVRDDMPEARPILGQSGLPTYRPVAQHPLAHEKVRFVGEPVAMACAATRAEAEDLIEEIDLDLDELPPVIDAVAAKRDPAVRPHEDWDDNLFLSLRYESGFAENAAAAAVVVERELSLSRQAMVPLEGKAVLATWDARADRLVVYASSQAPHLLRIGLAKFLGLDQRRVQVIAPDVGGAFGYKYNMHPEELCVAWLAMRFRAPFRYVEDRREHLVAGANTRQHHYRITGYADPRGRLLALDAEVTVDGGAYSNWHQTIGLEPGQIVGNLPGPYALPGYRVRADCVATNKPGFLPYRGVARTGVCFAMELMIDAIARAVDREPWEVRRDNLVPADAMPYRNVAGKLFDSGDYQKGLDMAREAIRFDQWRARQRDGEPDGRLIGIGFASYCEQSAHGMSVFKSWGMEFIPGYEQAMVRVTPEGAIEVRAGVHSHGQGMETTLAQVAHTVLGVDIADIQVLLGDTAETPFSTGTYASRSIVMTSGAVADACRALVPRLLGIGAHLMQAATGTVRLERGRVVGPQASLSLREVAEAWYCRPDRLPPDVDVGGLEATVAHRPQVDTGAFSYATHAAVVAVDPGFGHVEILDYVIVEDCGTLVNPMIVEGQTLGGAAQGIGTALYEESPYDAAGQPLAATLADYVMPGPAEIPDIRITHMETPSPYTAFGIKGMGEGGAIAPPAALANAVNDALRPLGVEIGATPLSPERVLAAILRGRAPARSDAAS
ncbi:xanthine dehydrogenase family protein molybdopterin-binding subunit [Rhodoplanes sp. TEM]|uniref:Xanthine dehydrogenase family protein molybdopterin-binding subunit n=1 Tax=Rhodoplanes tepidamans TaxID=200616 RepID=A0ABT5J4B8_RHOTP|nr:MULTISPECIES: xanthine dehydrogenase family protein molybdopterin-binding subunit [Rhodoplanes]MDC7784383.1 xanthine dehydrogenase family protein molybdopterin-binding subunit [Rhodoplanes tepidamans]MDC7985162.1 xanthine dehydrogenase family protein molybdopterin-binding subunit [Rhodoplanes sp. TEM]MDQ0354488.1 carbon-monoxide dehydrogenase large subunit [Rhodoplanes tepidamans]